MPKKQQKRSNGDGSIYYEKSRDRWVCAIIDPSGKRVVKRFKMEQEAKDYLTVIKSSIITNSYIQPTEYTFGQWLIDYIELYVKPYREASTIRTYINYANYAEPISEMPIQKITTNNLQNLINSLPEKLSDTSKNGIAAFLLRALKKAVNTRIISYNPMENVTFPKILTEEVETFTIEETNKILAYLSKMPSLEREYAIFNTSFATGARIGEVLALQTNDIFDTYISISKTTKKLDNNIVIGATKGKKKRNVPIPKSVINVLRKLKPNEQGFLFYTDNVYHTLLCANHMYDFWRDTLLTLNIPYRKIHAIRHTHATQLLLNGVTVTEVSQRLGHASPVTTLRTYSHVLKNAQTEQNMSNKVAQIFGI